jgi:hypothetical protein
MRLDPPAQRLRVAAWNRLVARLFGLPVHDPDCGLKLVRRDVLERVTLTATHAMVGTELLVKGLAAGATVSEVPFRELPRNPDEIFAAPGVARSLAELAGLYPPLHRLRRGSGERRLPRAVRRARRAPRPTAG